MWRRFNFIRRARSTSSFTSSSATSASTSSSSKPAAASASGGSLYARLLEQHPIKIKCLSSGVIMGSGDLACQWLTKRAKTEAAAEAEAGFDLWRTAKFGIMGSIIIGPVLHHWYGFLIGQFPGATTAAAGTWVVGFLKAFQGLVGFDHWSSGLYIPTKLSITVKRLLVDQTCFAPVFIPVFFTGLQFLDGNVNRGDIQAKLGACCLSVCVCLLNNKGRAIRLSAHPFPPPPNRGRLP